MPINEKRPGRPKAKQVSIEETARFKTWIRSAVAFYGITIADISEQQESITSEIHDVKWVRNQLDSKRPLSCENARLIYRMLMNCKSVAKWYSGEHEPDPYGLSAYSMFSWLTKWPADNLPSICVPRSEIEKLTAALTEVIAAKPGIGEKHRDAIATAIRRYLQDKGLELSRLFSHRQRFAMDRIARLVDRGIISFTTVLTDIDTGEERREPLNALSPGDLLSFSIEDSWDPFLRDTPVSRDVIRPSLDRATASQPK
jgi:hypothetical protein